MVERETISKIVFFHVTNTIWNGSIIAVFNINKSSLGERIHIYWNEEQESSPRGDHNKTVKYIKKILKFIIASDKKCPVNKLGNLDDEENED
jgi:hypothetical protein